MPWCYDQTFYRPAGSNGRVIWFDQARRSRVDRETSPSDLDRILRERGFRLVKVCRDPHGEVAFIGAFMRLDGQTVHVALEAVGELAPPLPRWRSVIGRWVGAA